MHHLALALAFAVVVIVPEFTYAAVATDGRVREAVERAYPHGLDESHAAALGSGAAPILVRLLGDPSVIRQDNLVAFLGLVGDEHAIAVLDAFLDGGSDATISPEADRARLQAPIALAQLARRGVPGAINSLLAASDARTTQGTGERAIAEQLVVALARVPQKEARSRLDALATQPSHSADGALSTLAAQLLGADGPESDSLGEDMPVPLALDGQARLHAIGISFANHVDAPSPITAARVDEIFELGSFLTRNEDSASDLGCCVHFTRAGEAGTLGAPGDGLDIISSKAELDAVLGNPSVRIKVVRAINWCGAPGTNFSGCAKQGGFGAVVVRLSDVGAEVGLWMHEYGHNAGLVHVADVRNLMSATGGYPCGPFSICPDDVLTQAQCNALHSPPGGTGMTPADIGVCGPLTCGDGQLDPFELCDDGNRIDGDGCTNACQVATCGDGVVFVGSEECDDGNANDEDDCLSDCTAAVCGDGVVQSDIEECDDSNLDEDDACLNDCRLATCGDGLVHVGIESCDDDGIVAGDGCAPDCRIEACHACAGVPSACAPVADGERCDDGFVLTDVDSCTAGVCVGTPLGLDGFVAHTVKTTRGTVKPPRFGPVVLTSAAGTGRFNLAGANGVAVPGALRDVPPFDPATALAEYPLRPASGEPRFTAVRYRNIINECLPTLARLEKPVSLMAPARLDAAVPPTAPDDSEHTLEHFVCHKAKQESRGPAGGVYPRFAKQVQVDVADGFQTRRYELKKLSRVCVATSLDTDPLDPPVIQSGPANGTPRPVVETAVRRPELRLACYKATLARRYVEQASCGPLAGADDGIRIEPRQEKHLARLGLFVASPLSDETLDTKKTIEICLASVEPTCGNDVAEAGEGCDGSDDDACPGDCSSACQCGVAGELMPCGAGLVDRWQVAVADGEDIRVLVETADTVTAADLGVRMVCGDAALDAHADDSRVCVHLPPRGLCPELNVQVPTAQTCVIEVSAVDEDGCADPARARYVLAVTRNGTPAAVGLVAAAVPPLP